ncbi:hypothetical protein AX17_006906 [Amanita inopinata Kibby_2008]|nr:hypothetical protein AX17_006906 [Amanita inopinata Kibby_2008]
MFPPKNRLYGEESLYFSTRKRRNHYPRSGVIIGEEYQRRRPNAKRRNLATCYAWVLVVLLLLSVVLSAAVYYVTIWSMRKSKLQEVLEFATTSSKNNTNMPPPPSMRRFQVPIVDRSVLDKLEYLHRASGDLEGLDTLTTLTGRWPPLVTRIPESKSSSAKTVSYADVMNLCGPVYVSNKPCRFLLPYRVAEQESKARLHFSQLVHLARALNRTLILPNVGKSRMGVCFGWDFEVYYDISGLDELGVQYARLDVLKAWIDDRASRRHSTSGQLLFLEEKSDFSSITDDRHLREDFNVRKIDNESLLDSGCFKSRFQNLLIKSDSVTVITIPSPMKTATTEIATKLINTLHGNTRLHSFKAPRSDNSDTDVGASMSEDPDILVINWDLRHSVFLAPVFDVRYSPRLIDLASKLAPPGPYLAVHWRMETIEPDNLPQCAYALVDTLVNILHDPSISGDIAAVWLASDVPFLLQSNMAAKSGTLKVLTASHQEAIEIVRAAFALDGGLTDWRLHTLEQALSDRYTHDGYHADWLDDSGVRGILDKIITAQAALFVGGTRRCSRISSYTKQIVDMRKASQKSRNSWQRNIVDLFG